MSTDDNEMLLPKDAGKMLGPADHPIAVATLAWWRCMGKGPHYVRLGRRVYYRRSDIERFIAKGLTNPESV